MKTKKERRNKMQKQTFIFDDEIFISSDNNAMEKANYHFDLPQGAWFGNEDDKDISKDTYKWRRGNFFD
jgi:hypothetical protein